LSRRRCRSDDFDAYFGARFSALLSRIEQVMGNPIARGGGFSSQVLVTLQAESAEFELEETAWSVAHYLVCRADHAITFPASTGTAVWRP
jgi:hypothetical protein